MKETTRIEKLIGKQFIYKQDNIRIKDYYPEPENGIVRIITDKEPITIKVGEIASFVKDLLPVEDTETQAVSTEIVQQTNGLMQSLQKALLDNIEQVKKDPNYVKQANTVNSSVNALIGMAKLQIQVARLDKK